MDTGSKPGDFEFEDNQEGEASAYSVEEIDVWEPISAGTHNPDNQSSEVQLTPEVTRTEEVEVWKRVNDELIRRTLVHRTMRLLEVGFICGLLVFIMNGNIGLLTTTGLLGLLLQIVFGYYFRHPKA